MVEPGEGLREVSFRQSAYRPAKIDRSLPHDFRYAGMGRVRRAKHMLAFELPVDAVLFLDRKNCEQFLALTVNERDIFTNADAIAEILCTGHRNRYRPEQPVCECHVFATTAPVCLAHEPVQRCIGTHTEHEQVGNLAAG